MRSALALLAVFALAACGSDVIVRPPTQVTVRLWGSVVVEKQSASLSFRISTPDGDGWHANKPVTLELDGHAWPIDVPVVPGDGQPRNGRFQIEVAALDEVGTQLAAVRFITSFVPREQRLLELRLIECPGEPICQDNPQCHDQGCQSCSPNLCPTPEKPGRDLAPLNPDQAVGTNPIQGDDGGDGDTDAGLDASVRDAGDGDGDGDGGQDAAMPCTTGLTKCDGTNLMKCASGEWQLFDECDFACYGNQCTGVCIPGRHQCGDADSLVPQVCGEDGKWTPNLDENGGAACPFLCTDGACTGDCKAGTDRCVDNQSQHCEQGAWVDGDLCEALCREGACDTPPSCGLNTRCRSNESCCNSHEVPGDEFWRSFDGVYYRNMSFAAKVSTFRLDRFEVTVSRFRKWLEVYESEEARPSEGDGNNPHDQYDTGWNAQAWNGELLTHVSDLQQRLLSCPGTTWTDAPSDDDDRPINCVTWYEAYAFCVWDGGRLPSEAEWNLAAGGGREQRIFPWSTPHDNPAYDQTFAVYDQESAASVGSKSAGDGKWGHADLGGNVQEWVRDWSKDPYRTTDCEDCADHAFSGCRSLRGGNYEQNEQAIFVGWRDCNVPEDVLGRVGFRCAR